MPKPKPTKVTPEICWHSETSSDPARCTIPKEVTIRGENFIPTVVRRLDKENEFRESCQFFVTLFTENKDGSRTEYTLTDVKFRNMTTLRATVPDSIPTGSYGVVVETPCGMVGEEGNLFKVDDGVPNASTDGETVPDVGTDSTRVNDTDADTNADPTPGDPRFLGDCTKDNTCDDIFYGQSFTGSCSAQNECALGCFAADCGMTCTDDVQCGLDCHAEICDLTCMGNSDCDLYCGSTICTAQNSGQGLLDVRCDSSSCAVSCPTSEGQCILSCTHAACEITDCQGGAVKCANGDWVCNTPCP